MTFTPNMPTAVQSLGETQPLVQGNFTAINTAISTNHVAMNTSGAGKHKFVEIPIRAAIPPGLVVNEGTLYSKTSTGSQLYYTPDNSGNEYQLTRTIAASFATFSTLTSAVARFSRGWTFLPGGMLLQYGFVQNPVNNDTIIFPVTFSSFGIVTLGGVRSDTSDKMISIKNGSITLSQFQIIASGTANFDFLYWQAVGK